MKYNKLETLAKYYKTNNVMERLGIAYKFSRSMVNDTFMKGLAAEELAKWYLKNYIGRDVTTDPVQDYIYDYIERNLGLSRLPDCYIDGVPCDVKQSYNFMEKAKSEGARKVIVVENFDPDSLYHNVLISIVDLYPSIIDGPMYIVTKDIVKEFWEWLMKH